MNDAVWWSKLRQTVREIIVGGPVLIQGLAYAQPTSTVFDMPTVDAFTALQVLTTIPEAYNTLTYPLTVTPTGINGGGTVNEREAMRLHMLPDVLNFEAYHPAFRFGLDTPGFRTLSAAQAATKSREGMVGTWLLPALPAGTFDQLRLMWTPGHGRAVNLSGQAMTAPAFTDATYRVRVLRPGGAVLHDAQVKPLQVGSPASAPASTNAVPQDLGYSNDLSNVWTVHALGSLYAPGERLTVEITPVLLGAAVVHPSSADQYADPNPWPAVRLVQTTLGAGGAWAGGQGKVNGADAVFVNTENASRPQVMGYLAHPAVLRTPAALAPVTVTPSADGVVVQGVGMVGTSMPPGKAGVYRKAVVEFRATLPQGGAGQVAAFAFGWFMGPDSTLDDPDGLLRLEDVSSALFLHTDRSGNLSLSLVDPDVTTATVQVVGGLTLGTWYRLELGVSVAAKVYDATLGVQVAQAQTVVQVHRPAAATGTQQGVRLVAGTPAFSVGGNVGGLHYPLPVEFRRWIEWSEVS